MRVGSNPDAKMRFTNRQRATLAAVVSLLAVPFVVYHARLAFQPYIREGGSAAAIAWTSLLAIYYVMARTALDLCRDGLDFLQGRYIVDGDGYHYIDQRRQKSPPYDLLTSPRIQRGFSNWQFAMMGWMFCELIIAWISSAGVLYTEFRSPYLSESSVAPQLTISWYFVKMSFFLVALAHYSMAYRWDLGLTPLFLRILGVPDTYPGQNRFPRWVNESAIKLFGKPM